MRLNCIVIAKFTLEEAGVIKERTPLNCNRVLSSVRYLVSVLGVRLRVVEAAAQRRRGISMVESLKD